MRKLTQSNWKVTVLCGDFNTENTFSFDFIVSKILQIKGKQMDYHYKLWLRWKEGFEASCSKHINFERMELKLLKRKLHIYY